MGWWYYGYRYKHRAPRPANGIKAKTQRGKFGKTWWASRWIAALERLMDSRRLQRGRSYARRGQVLEINISPGLVTSRVQGTRPQPYEVVIKIKPLTEKQWEKVADVMASQAVFAAKLLAGEMPQNIEEAFQAAGVSLFPKRRGDLATMCTCPDWANPCKHIAAVYYLLGEQFDEDPFLLFRLRGKDKEELLAMLRERRAEETALSASTEPIPEALPLVQPLHPSADGSFWEAGDSLKEVKFAIKGPEVEAAVLRRLGPPPSGLGLDSLEAPLKEVYRIISERTLSLAFGEKGEGYPH
ncbi:MAG TPA: hypothetical protein ENG33_04555 [Chloroflexi bacterium]|nr:hypothetical protein [Chloroflexota bacterium]